MRIVLEPVRDELLQSLQSTIQPPENGAGSAERATVQMTQIEEEQRQLEARQRINQAAVHAMLDTTTMLLQVQSSLLPYQAAIRVNEQRAYNRTKLLNAFLGTTVGAIGTGMQFSTNTGVQHAGDAVGVAGGVITAAFALCTAELAPASPSADQLLQSFTDDNKQQAIPEPVWNYIKMDPAFMSSIASAAKPAPSTKKTLSCHFRARPTAEQISVAETALSQLSNKLFMMNRDLAELVEAIPIKQTSHAGR